MGFPVSDVGFLEKLKNLQARKSCHDVYEHKHKQRFHLPYGRCVAEEIIITSRFAWICGRIPQGAPRTQFLAASIGRNRELSKLLESACFAGFALDLAYYKKEIPEMPNLFLTRPYQPDQNRSGFTPGDPRSSSPLICNN